MSVEPLTDRRMEYADKLRELANMIEFGQKQPAALYLQVFWKDHEITRLNRSESGFNCLTAGGLFLRMANEHAMGGGQENLE